MCQSPGHSDSIECGHDHQHRWSAGHPVAAGVHCQLQVAARQIHGCVDPCKLKHDNEHHRKNPFRPEKPLSNVAISYISTVSKPAVLLGCKHKEHDLHRQVPYLTCGQVHNQQQDHVGKLHPHQVNLVQHPQDHHGHLQHHARHRVLCVQQAQEHVSYLSHNIPKALINAVQAAPVYKHRHVFPVKQLDSHNDEEDKEMDSQYLHRIPDVVNAHILESIVKHGRKQKKLESILL